MPVFFTGVSLAPSVSRDFHGTWSPICFIWHPNVDCQFRWYGEANMLLLLGNPLEITYLFEKKNDIFHDSSKLHSCTLTNDLYLLTCSPLTVGIIKFNPEMHRHLFIMNVDVNILFHSPKSKTRWWFQMFFIFTPTWGNDPILTHMFQMGWNHQPENHLLILP